MMKENTPNVSNIAKREEEVLAYWKKEKIFEATVSQNKDNEPYVFYDGPPFATGLPHYGHLLAGTIKDIIPRYQTMRGRYVRREWGWDCHGLPIENLIEKELGLEHKKQIEEYGVERFNQKARDSVMTYDKEWKEIVPRMGRFVDMEKSYKTMDASYTESIWWAFTTLYAKKLIYEGYKSMHICPRCETTLAISEVGMNYKDLKDISVYVTFELVDEPGTYLIAWTTTPWTLPGNVAVAVHADVTYAKIVHEGKTYIIAKEKASEVMKRGFADGVEFNDSNISFISGKDLVGKQYKPLFPYYAEDRSIENWENGWKVVHADFVTTESGTGIVHEAPAFGEEDMELAKKLKLPMVQHVGMDGLIKPEVIEFGGMMAKPKDDPTRTDVEVIKVLAKKGVLFAKEKIEHSYPFCWRCDTPLLNYAASSWFVDVTKLKPRIIAENKEVLWVPENMRDGRFGKWLEGARDWAISRSRYWGAPLPVWKCNKCGNVESVGSLDALRARTKGSNEYFLMRHGEAENNVSNTVSYRMEDAYALTEQGRAQVATAIEQLRVKGITKIIASPLLRTKETATMVHDALGLPQDALTFDERLLEANTGVFNGKHIDSYRAYFANNLEKFTKAPEGGETLRDMKRRLGEFIYEINSKFKNERVLIVTHEYAIWLLEALAKGASDEQASALRGTKGEDYVQNAEVIAYDFAPIPHDRDFVLDFHRPFIDEISYHCSCELGMMSRIPEVFDCWFESGSMPFASVHYMGDNTTEEGKLFERNFPADFIAEGLDQTRGWFYSLIILSVGLFDRSPYRSVIVNGLVLAEDGQKMSKKLKNYPDPMAIVNKYGADALRMYLLQAPVVRAEDLRFSERGVDELFKKVILRLDNVRSFYDLYIGDRTIARDIPESKNPLDQWIIARLHEVVGEMTRALDQHELDRATRPITPFIDDLSTWYLRRSRDRFKEEGEDKEQAIKVLGWILYQTGVCIAPVMPFYAEDLYQKLSIVDKKKSVHLEDWSTPLLPDQSILEAMSSLRNTVSLGLELRAKAGVKVRQPLQSLTIGDEMSPEAFDAIILEELNIKQIIRDKGVSAPVLDTTITPELKREGDIRDLIRSLQELRKKHGLKPDNMVTLTVHADDEGMKLIKEGEVEIKRTVRVEKIEFKATEGDEVVIEGRTFVIAIGA